MTDIDSTAITTPARSRFRLLDWLHRHEKQLWWLHSLYALLLGIGIMWLGNRNYGFLRFTVLQVSFIWLSSLVLRRVMESPRLSPRLAGWIRTVINYFNKNFYQQVLFFVLPIYYASATIPSRNFFFVVLVALSATLSSLDLVYDRLLSVRRGLNAIFFAFNLFVLINVTLPVLWSIGNTWAMRVSGVLALAGFATLYFPVAPFRGGKRVVIAVSAILLGILIELGRGYVPPAPLRLVWSEFGTEFDRNAMRVAAPVKALEPGGPVRLYGMTAIRAPLGLKEKVRHRWYLDGKLIFGSAAFEITGGREDGFRLWTICSIEKLSAGEELHIDAETEGGQLIGRARIRVRG
jgi:hypothetical protein